MIGLSRNTFRIAESLRARLPGCLRVAGGPMPTLYPARYLPRFDAVFRGEADLSFPRFCRDLDRLHVGRDRLAELPLASYEGLCIDLPGLDIDNPPIHYREEEIASFPLPDRGGFDHAAYQEAWLDKDGSRTTSLLTTLGCPFGCDFCSKPIFGNLFRRRDLDAVFEEIAGIRALGYDRLWIADDSLTLSRRHLEEFCGRMRGRGLSWSCLARVDGAGRRDGGAHERERLLPGLPRPRIRQPGNPRADEQEAPRRGERAHGAHGIAKPASRSRRSSWSATPARASRRSRKPSASPCRCPSTRFPSTFPSRCPDPACSTG